MKEENCSIVDRSEVHPEAESQDDRREFLKKCGRFGAYTTPALLLLLNYQKAGAVAATSGQAPPT
jgi:hypothetical protein